MQRTEKAAILIVDDKPANIVALEALLASNDRRVINAQSGKDALKVALEEKIDLIILDVQMPQMDGFEVAAILKSNRKTKDIPIIFASAEKKEQASMMKGYEEGAIDYLSKPLDPDITRAKVSVLLKLQLQKKELLEKNALLERSALLINNSADIIGIVDASTLRIEQINHAFTTIAGYDPDEVEGSSLLSYLDTAGRKLAEQLKDEGEKKFSFETRICCKDSTLKWLNWNVVVKYNKWFVNAHDITGIRQVVRQLEAANKELESFSYSVSHDLRAPLRALHGNARILEEDYSARLDEEAKIVINKIHANVNRMDTLIKDLLSFSKISKREVRKSMVNMEQQVRHIFEEVSNGMLRKAALRLGDLPDAFGDYSMLNQVWTNLISNAIKYSAKKESPVIEVGSQDIDGEREYFIKDNGAGFDMAYAGKLFGTFQRLHDASEFEGTGIGLAIVQRIILKHGGTIRADAAPEKGAAFYFKLPREQ